MIQSKLKILLFVLLNIIIFGCNEDLNDTYSINRNSSGNRPVNLIEITSFGTKPSSILNENLTSSKINKLAGEDEFQTAVEFESSESIVLPHLQRYIYPGSLLKGNSIQDLGFVPISANINPVRVSLSIPATNYEAGFTMEQPSLSSLRTLVNEYLKTANFSQNGQLSYSIEQFSSYDELKVAFGSNVDTRKLFNKQSTTENQYGHMIAKRTGFYVKFYQTSFTLDMDIPNGGSLVKDRNFDDGGVEPVYVSSISYGRMGVLAIETDEYSEEASKIINTTFSKIFKSGNTTLTEEELKLINSADFKLLLLGGNANTAVQSFKGYEAFVQHISQGVFSKENPGIPIFCSYSYLNDNSPVKTKFKFDIKRPPLYVELVFENEKTEHINRNHSKYSADVIIKYYSSRSKMPVIASPYININLSKNTYRPGRSNTLLSSESVIKQNTLYQTSNIIEKQIVLRESFSNTFPPSSYFIEYKILPDENFNYIPLN
ncbi:thiol-activated cytolysin family protein [Empedobacter falsenii]|uniref:Thiol-activated cytolysin n=1 Tax=Empedobacter falsenii TaxID=343874 RepID=A0A376G9M3_9FLAO|nr:thiol-activated cytolysin family protein [Empedobacter falsenii]STD55943.1 Thiol-activated cytolysin [Empedobacter falsenii]